MARKTREWSKEFIEYTNKIKNDIAYIGLPIKEKKDGGYAWLAPARSEIGKERKEWCIEKAKQLELIKEGQKPYSGIYADVMLKIHPTKSKPCQICGKEMSLYYRYPNTKFLKSLNETFKCDFTTCDDISDIWDKLISNGVDATKIASFIVQKGDLKLDPNNATKEEIIDKLEETCRKGEKNCLGPGAMSNFPDRFDGFHSYNRCCRSSHDMGRSKENLKSYSKDRRAYEYWSDGNIRAADQFMKSQVFVGKAADHVGPISLGFVHDPRYLRPMSGGDNSSKRNRLQIIDIEEIINIYKHTKVYPMSWQSKLIWEYIKDNYKENPEKVPYEYRDMLLRNMSNYMYILWRIHMSCDQQGDAFLVEAYLKPHFDDLLYDYEFDIKGNITQKKQRHLTDRSKDETDRYIRVAIQSVCDYNRRNNRNVKNDLTEEEIQDLRKICEEIKTGIDVETGKSEVLNLIEKIENRLIDQI